MVRTSTDPGATVGGGPARDDRSHTSQVQRVGSNEAELCAGGGRGSVVRLETAGSAASGAHLDDCHGLL